MVKARSRRFGPRSRTEKDGRVRKSEETQSGGGGSRKLAIDVLACMDKQAGEYGPKRTAA